MRADQDRDRGPLRCVAREPWRVGKRAVERAELELAELPQSEALQRAVGADEALDELVGRIAEDSVRGVVLRENAAVAEDRDPVAHLDRLVRSEEHTSELQSPYELVC